MNETAWMKIHSLESKIQYLQDERNSKPEQVNAKHAWDMILCYILRELSDVKEILMKEESKKGKNENQ